MAVGEATNVFATYSAAAPMQSQVLTRIRDQPLSFKTRIPGSLGETAGPCSAIG
jgi:hypothetical protein